MGARVRFIGVPTAGRPVARVTASEATAIGQLTQITAL
jgi:hypothetical protein